MRSQRSASSVFSVTAADETGRLLRMADDVGRDPNCWLRERTSSIVSASPAAIAPARDEIARDDAGRLVTSDKRAVGERPAARLAGIDVVVLDAVPAALLIARDDIRRLITARADAARMICRLPPSPAGSFASVRLRAILLPDLFALLSSVTIIAGIVGSSDQMSPTSAATSASVSASLKPSDFA